MPRLDHLSKTLPLACIHDIVATYLPSISDITPLPNELTPPPMLHADTVYHAIYRGRPCIIHIEMQTRGDPDMPRRIYQYAAQLNSAYEDDRPVYSFVIWFTKGQVPEPIYRVMEDEVEINRWRYRDITVYTLTKEQIVAQGIGLLPFAAFAQDMQVADVVPFAQTVQAMTPPELGTLLVNIYVAMMQQRFPSIDPVQVLRRIGVGMNTIEEILWNSSLSNGVKDRIAKESREQGLAEGKAEGLVVAIASFWPLKFATALPDDLRVRLASFSVEQLEDLLHHWSDEPASLLARIHTP